MKHLAQILTGCFFLFYISLNANNIQIQQLELVENQELHFQISWDHAWNVIDQPPYNHDAVWVFGKYRVNQNTWEPLHFSKENELHQSSALDVHIQGVEDEMGVFLRSDFIGNQSVNADIVLGLNENFENASNLEIRLFAMEMVYVPEGAFYLGDGAASNSFIQKNTLDALYIDSENALNVNDENGLSCIEEEALPFGDIPANYPKGFAPFYGMKYEITQQQYADFLNTLTYQQQAERTINAPSNPVGTPAFRFENRNSIVIKQSGWQSQTPAQYACNANANDVFNELDDGGYRACNFLNRADILAYLDWAGLRPMTELEYEKACRGPLESQAKEFVWGTQDVTDATELLEDGTAWEGVNDTASLLAGLANYNYSPIDGPLRTGFAAQDYTNRIQSGATYYGMMEMSGNLWEYCINVDSVGLQFDGKHGDGQLDENGNANVVNWATQNYGSCLRGGGWNSGDFEGYRDAAISARFYANFSVITRRNTVGGRGVRTP